MKKTMLGIFLLSFGLMSIMYVSASDNVPYCMDNPMHGYSWYDENGPITWSANCNGCSAVYSYIGTSAEGWYSSCDKSLIKLKNVELSGYYPGCNDTDGKDYYQRGVNKIEGISTIEICVWDDGKPTNGEDGTQVTETYCENNNKTTEIHICPNGCKAGACVKIIPENNAPLDFPAGIQESEKALICQGCASGKCYAFGFRKDNSFCSDESNTFLIQKELKSQCKNNFECNSNLCIDNKCASGSLFARFFRWLGGIFG